MRNILTNNFRKFDILAQIKFYLIITNNVCKQIKIKNNLNIFAKERQDNKQILLQFNLIYICIIITIVKSIIIALILILFILINTKNSKKSNCFTYYKYKYLIQDYWNDNTRLTIIKKLQISLSLNYNF